MAEKLKLVKKTVKLEASNEKFVETFAKKRGIEFDAALNKNLHTLQGRLAALAKWQKDHPAKPKKTAKSKKTKKAQHRKAA